MCIARNFAVFICVSILASLPAAASNLVTGNGFGFAVVSPSTSTVTCFYAHPYSFTQPDPKDPLSEGIPTANFIKSVGWNDGGARRRVGRIRRGLERHSCAQSCAERASSSCPSVSRAQP